MAEDKQGRMWFGVADGVRVYDGVTWTSYSKAQGLSGGVVRTLCVADDGSVYTGGPGGIYRFRDEQWTHIFPPEGDWPWGIMDIEQVSDGSLWIGTLWGPLRIDGETLTLYSPADAVGTLKRCAPYVTVVPVPDGIAPSRAWPDGLGMFAVPAPAADSAEAIVIALAQGGPAEESGLKVGDRITGTNSQIRIHRWSRVPIGEGASLELAVEREGVPEAFSVTVANRKIESVYHDFSIYDVYEDRQGNIWLGLFGIPEGGEIAHCVLGESGRPDASTWRLYAEADGLSLGWLPRILQTRDGTVWTVSYHSHKGINRFDGKAWTSFRLREMGKGSDMNPSLLETRDGTLWVGQNGGLSRFRDGDWMNYRRLDVPAPAGPIGGLLESSDGSLWAAGWEQEAVRLDYRTSRWTTYDGLLYFCDTSDGSRWYISVDDGVVRHEKEDLAVDVSAGTWMRYGTEDGLMEFPIGLAITGGGVLWAYGSHAGQAATARFDGRRWTMDLHPLFSWGILPASVLESSDGSMWFGTGGWPSPERGHLGGVLRFHPQARPAAGPSALSGQAAWTHYTPPEALFGTYAIGQTADGRLWFGSPSGLRRYDGEAWSQVTEQEELTTAAIDDMCSARNGDLWVGTREYGVFHFDGNVWNRHDANTGLSGNRVRGITQTLDGSVWVRTEDGTSRFDGRSWTTCPQPLDRVYTQAPDGALWSGTVTGPWRLRGNPDYPHAATTLQCTRYEPDTRTPETEVVLYAGEVSQPGNTTIAWKGSDLWKSTPEDEIQYAWRMDPSTALGAGSGEWSAFSYETSHIFELLPSGNHTFEVKARDRDFNEDPTPATVTFTVTPHVYEEPWFIALMIVLLGAIGFQTGRVARSHRRLRESNDALSDANKDLHVANVELNRERAVERVRAEVTGMESVDDLKHVVEEMLRELNAAGVDFNLCVVNIIDEEAGTRTQYGATEAGWAGEGTMPLSEVSEGFLAIHRGGKTVLRQVDDHLADRVASTRERTGVAGQPVPPTALVDVPFDHGTLSLSTRRPDGFRDEDVALLEEMARVIALGYARFLDFQGREAQRRQLALDAALERIRAEVASMEKADDIGRVMGMVFKEIRELGVETDSAVIMVVEEEARRIREYCMMPQEAYTVGVEGTPATANIAEDVDLYTGDRSLSGDDDQYVGIWRSQKSRYSPGGGPRSEEAARRSVERNRALFGITAPLEAFTRKQTTLAVPFSHGVMLFNNLLNPNGLTEDHLSIAEDFARMISLGYARFLDFQRLEEQNRALEEANEEIQQANRLKSQFLANMSHELRTPMNSIIGFTRLVLRRGAEALSERHRKNLEVVKLSADHLLYLINEILDLSKIEAGRLEVAARRFDVKTLIQSCCETVGPTMGKTTVELHDDVPDDIGEAHTDDSRLRQIVINLLSNAMKFTDEGEVRISAARDGDSLAISVSDTGPGIPEDKLDTIFEAFQQIDGSTTRRHGGTGLGLSITKSLAELLGGTVEVESRVGEGSTFTVRIPVTFGAPVAHPTASTAGESVPQGQEHERTVVVIDDDPNVAFLLREELAEVGYRVVSAGSADEGMAMVKRLRPVAVTVDIIMPDKDGWETIRMLKGDPETRDVPIVVVSVSDNKELGYQLGVYDYLMKPADSEAILSVLKRLEADGTRDILVVDDDPNAVSMITQLLEAEGLVARSATNGQGALDEIARARPDAIFLDLLMPVMDGFGVIERLQQDADLRKIPVIVITAKDLTAEEKTYLQEHASQVVEKGKLEPNALVKELRQTLNDYARSGG